MNCSVSELQEAAEHGILYWVFGSRFASPLYLDSGLDKNALSRHWGGHAAQDLGLSPCCMFSLVVG